VRDGLSNNPAYIQELAYLLQALLQVIFCCKPNSVSKWDGNEKGITKEEIRYVYRTF
jgi:hypothetical protein